MKIAIISDTHFGYARFEEDSFVQAEAAFLDAQEKADLIIYAGDIFDIKIPKLETLHRAIHILKKIRKPIYAIHGNHERRSKEMVNPVMLLARMGLLHHLHGEDKLFEQNGETVQIFGLGNIPEDYSRVALQQALKNFTARPDAFKILVLHQSIKDLIPQAEEEISTADLTDLPFDLFIDGHIHTYHSLMNGKLLIPGSTVITQLKKHETQSKGYLLYDTQARTHEFIPISCRPFFFEELHFEQASANEVQTAVIKKIQELRAKDPDAIIRIKITGQLKQGSWAFDGANDVYVDNDLENAGLKANLEKIHRLRQEKTGVKELALQQLKERTQSITLFDPLEFFDQLAEDTEKSMEYLEALRKK